MEKSKQLSNQLQIDEVEIDTALREQTKLIKTNEKLLVDQNLMKLKIKKLSLLLEHHLNKVILLFVFFKLLQLIHK